MRTNTRPGTRTMPEAQPPAPLWLLALITLSGTMAIHIFVPALPLVVEAFGTTPAAAQMTLSAYIVGLALVQVVCGPAADHFGRRPVLIAGMLIYAVAGGAAYFSPNIETLIVARFFEAVGGGSGLVLGRAMVRDGSTHEEAAKKLSLMNLMVMLGPGLSPLVGGVLAAATGWRSIFLVLCALGLLNLALIWRRLPARPRNPDRDWKGVIRDQGRLARSPRFLGYAIGGGFATASIYAYIGAAPFIFVDQLHRPGGEVALYLALNFVGVWLGSLTASHLAGRVHTERLLVAGNLASCLGAALFLLAAATGALNVALAVLPMLVLSYGAGLASPMAMSGALSVNPAATGSASGLYGSAQMVVGALCNTLSGIGGNPALAAALTLTGAGILAQLSFWIARRSRW